MINLLFLKVDDHLFYLFINYFMKKIYSILVFGVFLAALVLPMVSSAAIGTVPQQCTISDAARAAKAAGVATCDNPCVIDGTNANCGICCMMNSVLLVTDWIFYVLTLVVVIMFIWGGFSYITAAGDPEKAGKGKKILTYGIIGLAIALLAKAIPSVVRFIVGM